MFLNDFALCLYAKMENILPKYKSTCINRTTRDWNLTRCLKQCGIGELVVNLGYRYFIAMNRAIMARENDGVVRRENMWRSLMHIRIFTALFHYIGTIELIAVLLPEYVKRGVCQMQFESLHTSQFIVVLTIYLFMLFWQIGNASSIRDSNGYIRRQPFET